MSGTVVRHGSELLDDEAAAFVVRDLTNKVTISLEGVDVVRGEHKSLGVVTLVMPASGMCSLLYPFENEQHFCYEA